MTVSRRGLFGLAAGAAAVPFSLPVETEAKAAVVSQEFIQTALRTIDQNAYAIRAKAILAGHEGNFPGLRIRMPENYRVAVGDTITGDGFDEKLTVTRII